MNKKYFLLLLMFSIPLVGQSQIIFEKRLGPFGTGSMVGRNIVENIYGDFYETGTGATDFFSGGTTDLHISKLSSDGTLIWSRRYYNLAIGNDTLSSQGIAALSDGGFMIAGTVITPDTIGEHDIMIARFDSAGNVVWSKMIGDSTSNSDLERGITVAEAPDGNFFLTTTGEYYAKISPAGSILWQKKYSPQQITTYCKSIVVTNDGGFAIGGDNLKIIKFDSNGNQQWKTTPTFPSYQRGRGTSICKTNDGGYAVAGIAGDFVNGNVASDSRDITIAKYDSSGTLQWIKKYLHPYEDFPVRIFQDSQGDFIVAGSVTLTAYVGYGILLKIDSAGNSQIAYTSPVPYSGFFYMNRCDDGGYVLTGNTRNGTASITTYVLCIKTNSALSMPCFNQFVFVDSTYNITSVHNTAFNLTDMSYAARDFSLVNSGTNNVTDYCLTLDVLKIFSENNIEVFPNPFADVFTIEAQAEVTNLVLEISNIFGQKISSFTFSGSSKQISFNVPEGIYFISVKDPAGNLMAVKKIIKI